LQVPLTPQVPVVAYVVTVFVFLQTAAGGVLHVSPAQGPALHAPLAQPNSQLAGVDA